MIDGLFMNGTIYDVYNVWDMRNGFYEWCDTYDVFKKLNVMYNDFFKEVQTN